MSNQKNLNMPLIINDTFFKSLAIDSYAISSITLSTLPNTLAIYAFGSRIAGNANLNSDLDLAVLIETYVEPLILWDISCQLAELANCEVDFLDMRSASTIMQYQVLTTGICLWSKQPQAGIFESYVFSEKTELDSARFGLLADIQQQGKVYAR